MTELTIHKSGRRAIYLLFTANTISLIGNQLTLIAIPWFVPETTGSAAQTGLTAFFNFLPIVIAGFFGGAIVDRLGYKRMSIVANIASGITVAFVPLLFGLGLLPFWLLLVLVFLSSLLDAPGSTARAALVPELAEAAAMPLERASSLLQIVERASGLVGVPLDFCGGFHRRQPAHLYPGRFASPAGRAAGPISVRHCRRTNQPCSQHR